MKPDDFCMGCMEAKGEELICPQCGYREEEEFASPFYLPPGTILEGKYLLGRVLGQGGFGITYIAWDTNLKIKLAVKEYFPQELASRSIGASHISAYTGSKSDQYQYGLSKYLQEAQTLAQFDGHPNIVSVRDYFQANGTAYLVMSYVDGVTLKEYLAQSGGKLTVKQATGIIMPVLDALKEVHSVNIMHRDISPDNIYINRRGQVILLDFGAARQAISEHGRSLSIILKPGYAPEEQYRTRGEQGPWTDIYAVAATYYHLVTGVQPPEAMERLIEDTITAPSQLGVQISPEQEEYLFKAMAVRAKDRYQTAEEFQTALLTSDQGLKEKASDLQETEQTDSKKVIIYATAVILSALLLYGGVSLFGSDPETGLQETEQAEPVEETDENSTGNGSEPESETIIQPGTDFPVKLESNRILNDGDDYIHGLTYGYDYLWASTRTSPTRILRINPQTLDYDRLILPSGYDMAEDIIAHDGYIWAITYTVPTRIIRIDPYNLQYDVPVEFRSGELDYGGALEYANNHLWAGGVGAIARIDLNNMSYDLFSYDGIDQQIHALASGGGYLWAAVPRNYTLLRINLDNPNSSNRITESNLYISDDMVFVNGHLFAGTENAQPYRILKVAPDLSYVDVVQLSGCYGVFSVRDEIWSTNISTPGVIARYDLDLNLTDNVLLPSEFNDPNELVIVNDNVYFTTWQSPAGILSFQIENVP